MKRHFCSCLTLALIATLLNLNVIAAEKPSLPQDSAVDPVYMYIVNKNDGGRELHIPITELKGKSLPAFRASFKQAIDMLIAEMGIAKTRVELGQEVDIKPAWAQDEFISKLSERAFDKLTTPTTDGSEQLSPLTQAAPPPLPCASLTIGFAPTANAAREYQTAAQTGDGAIAFWPTFLPPQIPNATYAGNWNGASGVNFWGRVRRSAPWYEIFHPWNSYHKAMVLQYRISAISCNSLVVWVAQANIHAPTPWYMNTGFGIIRTDWLLYVDPYGIYTFPSTSSSFQFINAKFGHSVGGTQSTYTTEDIEGEFRTLGNMTPQIYLGMNLDLYVDNGEVSTIRYGGLGDRFEFPYGVFYLQVPTD